MFSANLGFLWTELPFLERVAAARAAGFEAVEFHDQAQAEDPGALREALAGTRVMGLNVSMTDQGRAALPGEEAGALEDFRAALAVADAVDAGAIHVMGGRTGGPEAGRVAAANLSRFADLTDRTLLIEPLCRAAAPGYWLHDPEAAAEVIERTGRANVRLMFDAFHVAQEGYDPVEAWERFGPVTGHVQIAHPVTRHEPDGTLAPFMRALRTSGWDAPVGAEYRPEGRVEDGLGWREVLA